MTAARRKKTFGEDLDWYLISIDKIKKVATVIILVAIVAAGVYFGLNYFQSPKTKAHMAIKSAQEKADKIAQLPAFVELRQDYIAVEEKIQEAQKLYNLKRFKEVIPITTEASNRADRILREQNPGSRNPDAKIVRLEGKVQIQRRGQGTWNTAKPRDDLFAGDYVRTLKNGACHITVGKIIIQLGSDTLYEVTSKKEKTSTGKQKVRFITGIADIFAQDKGAKVENPVLSADLNKQSVAQFRSRGKKSVEATVLQGSATAQYGGQTTTLSERERLRVRGNSAVKSTILESPSIVAPPDNRAFSVSSPKGVRLQWQRVPNAVRYHVQIAKTSYFTKLLQNVVRPKNYVTVLIDAVGDYYWRVSAIDAKGEEGVFSEIRHFQMVLPRDWKQTKVVKPKLSITSLDMMSRSCVVKGTVEPGAQVEINGEKVDVNGDNTFTYIITFNKLGTNQIIVKATNASGGETIKKKNVIVEEY